MVLHDLFFPCWFSPSLLPLLGCGDRPRLQPLDSLCSRYVYLTSSLTAAGSITLLTQKQAAATLLIFAYYTLSLCRFPHLYSPWAVLGLEIFGVIFWLTSFALCAEWTATFNHSWWTHGSKSATSYGFWNAPFRPEDIGLASRSLPFIGGLMKRAAAGENMWKASVGLMGAAAGLGAVQL